MFMRRFEPRMKISFFKLSPTLTPLSSMRLVMLLRVRERGMEPFIEPPCESSMSMTAWR